MADWNDTGQRTNWGSVPRAGDAVARRATYDAGLRSYMLSIYNYMASGILLTGVVALLTAQSGFATGPVMLIGGIGSFVIVMAMSFGMNRFGKATLQGMFWGYAVVMGLFLSSVLVMYTGASVAATFFATAGAFAGLSLVGYTTKKDLSGFGTFLIMGVIGLVVAMVLNIFIFKSTGLELAISFLGVLIFAGLTAYDTQKLKLVYDQVRGTEFMGKVVIMGALTLYLDFINMFLFLLRFMGNSRG